MSIFNFTQGCLMARISTLVLATTIWHADVAQAEIIPLADMLHGTTISAAQCAAKRDTVWVTAFNQGFCLRYYVSTAGGDGRRPIVLLSGDKLGPFNRTTGLFSPAPKDGDVDTINLIKRADVASQLAGAPAIYLARIGIDGSSGFHGVRKTNLELEAVNAALNAIKIRYRLDGFHLVGQSGGAGLIGSLLGMRHDVGCAVLGSGPLYWGKINQPSDPALQYPDPTNAVPAIAQNRSTRILVVTDPADQRVPIERQSTFVRNLREAGGRVEQFFVQSTDPEHHGVVGFASVAAAGCVRGASDQVISLKLGAYQQTVLAHATSVAHATSSGATPAAPTTGHPQKVTTTRGGRMGKG